MKELDISWIDDEIRKVQRSLSELSHYDKDDKLFVLYKELIAIRGEFIEQYHMLLDIRDRMLIPIMDKNKSIEIPYKQFSKVVKSPTAYEEFINSIESPTYAEMREVKEELGFFKKRKRKSENT
jgi:hypothetical protein